MIKFYIANAFTTDRYGGNPAAVVVVDEFPDATVMQKIAKNFNQPMTAFLRLTHIEGQLANFDVRWFSPEIEVPLCGHATVVSSKVIFTLLTPELVPESVTTLRFHTASGRVLTARQDGEWIEITLVAAEIHPLPQTVVERLRAVISQGLGKEVSLKFAGVGKNEFDYYLLAEIDEADDLAECKLDAAALLATSFTINIITSSSSDPNVAFVSRMFAPAAGVHEDPVCGSAHCLLGPYWSQKLDRGDSQMLAKQVSKRGGLLKVTWKQNEGLVALAGQAAIVMEGELL